MICKRPVGMYFLFSFENIQTEESRVFFERFRFVLSLVSFIYFLLFYSFKKGLNIKRTIMNKNEVAGNS